ncbi:MAG: calcium/sodium antiporter [Phycisphaerae bacterium]
MLTFCLFAIGFLVLIKGADWLITGASQIARILKVSDLAVGLTIVAFGTSLPEFFINIFASAGGNTDLAISNILGSNTFNILLILGLSSIIYPLSVQSSTVWKEIPLTLLAAAILGILVNDKLIDKQNISVLSRIDGIVLISYFVIFIYYTFSISKPKQSDIINLPCTEKPYGIKKSVSLVVLGLLCLAVGAKWTVDGAVQLSEVLGISKSLVGLTIVAIGTSLPELATSAVAAYKKNADIAVGNIVGSNIFNIFFILGTSAIIRPLPFQSEDNTDIIVTAAASLLLFICMFTGKKNLLDRWEGIVAVLLYGGYIVFVIFRG